MDLTKSLYNTIVLGSVSPQWLRGQVSSIITPDRPKSHEWVDFIVSNIKRLVYTYIYIYVNFSLSLCLYPPSLKIGVVFTSRVYKKRLIEWVIGLKMKSWIDLFH